MGNIIKEFISFFIPYLITVLSIAIPLAVTMAKNAGLQLMDYHKRIEGILKDELSRALSEKKEAEFQLTAKTAEIEWLAKKVATLERELSALRANSSKRQ